MSVREQRKHITHLGVVPDIEPSGFCCKQASDFASWIEKMVVRLADEPTVGMINQERVRLMQRWFQAKNASSHEHHYHPTNGAGGLCLAGFFAGTVDLLHELETNIEPPSLALPEPPEFGLMKARIALYEEKQRAKTARQLAKLSKNRQLWEPEVG